MTATTSGTVIVVGSVNTDLTVYTPRHPAPGETISGTGFQTGLGGKGANQAVATARGGSTCHFVACVGSDSFGDTAIKQLTAAGVTTTHLQQIPDTATGVAHIRVDAAGENNIVIVPEANAHLTNTDIDAALRDTPARVLLTQLESPLPQVTHALQAAHAAGVTTVLDPAPATPLPDSIWQTVDIIIPNETEAEILTGIRVTDRASAERAADWFLQRGVTAALITLAGDGALLKTRDSAEFFAPHRVTVVDTTAAGDTFAGFLAAALASGNSIADAIRLANAAGALTVTRAGAAESIPTRAEVQEFLEQTTAA